MENIIEKRKEKIKEFFNKLNISKNKYIFIILILLIIFGTYIRVLNLPLIKDVTNGKYISVELDSFVFLRYAQYIVDNGQMMQYDTMRYVPIGYNPIGDFRVLSYFIAYLYKFIHAFSPSVTLDFVDVIYPVIAFAIGMIFFFLLVRKLFNKYVAIIATAFLIIIPTYLQRTIAGFSDKEALAFTLLFASLYFFVCFIKEEELKKTLLLAVISGILLGLMALVWGGISLIIYGFAFYIYCSILWNKVNKNKLYAIIIWFSVASFLMLFLSGNRYTLDYFISEIPILMLIFGIFTSIIFYYFNKKDWFGKLKKFREKYPSSFLGFIVSGAISLIFLIIIRGPNYIITILRETITDLTTPFGRNRWALTVAESRQPYLVELIPSIGELAFYIILIGSIFVVYNLLKTFDKKIKYTVCIVYSFFMLSILYSIYSSNSIFNGRSFEANLFYFGGIFLFLFLFIYGTYYLFKKKEYDKLKDLVTPELFFVFWFLISLVAARSAVRLFMFLAPVASIALAYFIYFVFDYIKSFKNNIWKFIGYIIIILIFAPMWWNFQESTVAQAKSMGPSYNYEWQIAMDWVRNNTPKDAVFAHWWDYGHWVVTGGERSAISDGGNARPAINHFVGRYLLTAPNYTDTLDFLYANKVAHVLIVSDEIGKYTAFSSIGADANYDRFSWIQPFVLDKEKSYDITNNLVYTYAGNFPFDDDFIYQGEVFPRKQAGIIAIQIPIKKEAQNSPVLTRELLDVPIAQVVKQGKMYQIPLKCLFFYQEEITFDVEGLDGCFRLIPAIIDPNTGQTDMIGAGLYLSKDVRDSRFTHLYLYDEQNENFKKVYDDSAQFPLAFYSGRIIGPLKIWEMHYPENQKDIPWMRGIELPDPNVNNVLEDY